MNIQPGDFCCIPISGGVGRLISVGQWLNGDGFGDFDHAEIFIGQADDKAPFGYTIGAYPSGAAKLPLPCPPEDLPSAIWSSGVINPTDEQRDTIVKTAIKLLGIRYSALDYFALVLHRLRVPAPGLKRYIGSTGHMICSQLVDYIYYQAGYHLFKDDRWFGYVTPAMLADLIKESSSAVL